MIVREFTTPSHNVRVTPGKEYVGLDIDGCTFTLPWDKISDVEYLVSGFGHLLVMDFRPIVEELGVVYSNRHLYEMLL